MPPIDMSDADLAKARREKAKRQEASRRKKKGRISREEHLKRCHEAKALRNAGFVSTDKKISDSGLRKRRARVKKIPGCKTWDDRQFQKLVASQDRQLGRIMAKMEADREKRIAAKAAGEKAAVKCKYTRPDGTEVSLTTAWRDEQAAKIAKMVPGCVLSPSDETTKQKSFVPMLVQSPRIERAKVFLATFLAKGAKTAKSVQKAAVDAGHNQRTIERTRAALGIVSTKTAGGWNLALRDQDRQDRHETMKQKSFVPHPGMCGSPVLNRGEPKNPDAAPNLEDGMNPGASGKMELGMNISGPADDGDAAAVEPNNQIECGVIMHEPGEAPFTLPLSGFVAAQPLPENFYAIGNITMVEQAKHSTNAYYDRPGWDDRQREFRAMRAKWGRKPTGYTIEPPPEPPQPRAEAGLGCKDVHVSKVPLNGPAGSTVVSMSCAPASAYAAALASARASNDRAIAAVAAARAA
jgi:hypothetical protein